MSVMTDDSSAVSVIECSLLWKLARIHGWSTVVEVADLASDANVSDERAARTVARNQLANRSVIGYHQGKDEIWLRGPSGEDLFY